MTSACILGCAGPKLSDIERGFFREARPWGFILFKRNVETPDQVRALVEALRAAADREDAVVLIDQEGGRVQRLGPPHWPAYSAGADYGRLYDRDPLHPAAPQSPDGGSCCPCHHAPASTPSVHYNQVMDYS